MGKEKKSNQDRQNGYPKSAEQKKLAAEMGSETLPWMNGKRIKVDLEPIRGASTTVYVGSVADTYAGDGGVPHADPAALAAFERIAQAVSNTPGFKSDDCLTQNTSDKRVPKGPVVRAHLVGRNAKGSATFVYFADTRIQDNRSLLYMGASLGDRRRQFENRLSRLSYSSTGSVAASSKRMH